MPEPVEITFLGTGAAIPSLKRRHSAILLHYGKDYILFDCGEGTQIQLEKARISPMKISRIFITHWHADHFGGLLPLIETLHLCHREKPLEIYGPEATRFIDALIELSYWGIGFNLIPKDCGENNLEKILDTETFEIYSIKVNHSVPAVGYMFKEKDHWHIDMKKASKFGLKGRQLSQIKQFGKIKIKNKIIKLRQIAFVKPGRKIIYSGDTLITKNIFKNARNADLLIHDGTFVEPFPGRAHPSVAEIAKLAKKYKVKKLVLTHLSRRYKTSNEILKVVKPIFKNAIIAEDMKRLKL